VEEVLESGEETYYPALRIGLEKSYPVVCKYFYVIIVYWDWLDIYRSLLMGISLCAWSLWGWFFSQHLELLLG
jgi:hypothetical protein